MTEVSTGPPGGRWTPSEKGTTMDTIDRSLALTSLREPAPDRIRPRGSAAPTRLGALVAAGGAALATIEASRRGWDRAATCSSPWRSRGRSARW